MGYRPLMSGLRHNAVDHKIVALIREVVRESMEGFGLHAVSVRAGQDHDGDPVLFVEADYNLTDTPIDMVVTAALTTKLRDRLWEAGETRFPHVRHMFPEHQKIKKRRSAHA